VTMRRIHMFQRVSANGYFASPSGDLDWVVQEPALDADAGRQMTERGAMIFGRKTYQGFASFWPTQLGESPTADAPHGPPRRSEALKKMAVWIDRAEKLVFSHTLHEASWHGTKLLGAFAAAKVEELKRGPGSDIMIFGSGSIVSLLTEHGLIDDYTFVLSPIVLGSGALPIRDVTAKVALKLLDVTQFEHGNVRLRYAKA
jgi:dihydrofolate reductase